MAIVNVKDTERRRVLLIDAFKEPGFQKDIGDVCGILEAIIDKWVKSITKFDPRIDNVFSVQSRVKDETTFEEKIFRKNYIQEWEVTDDMAVNQKYIKLHLTDLIGIRINCYFAENEERLYNQLQYNQGEVPDCEFNFNENTVQANGHRIFKFSGVFKKEYHFEVQIKSIVHNVWGEVEHKTVYKNPSFDGYINKKREISGALYDVLLASDRELFSLFNMKESEHQLIRSLFFCKTQDIIREKCKTSILAYHYERYFNVFTEIEPFKAFVIESLSERTWNRQRIEPVIDHIYDKLVEAVNMEFPHFYINCIYEIDSLINEHESLESFMYYFLKAALPDIEKHDDFDDELRSAFGDSEEEAIDNLSPTVEDNDIENYMEKLDELLLGCRIKKDNN